MRILSSSVGALCHPLDPFGSVVSLILTITPTLLLSSSSAPSLRSLRLHLLQFRGVLWPEDLDLRAPTAAAGHVVANPA